MNDADLLARLDRIESKLDQLLTRSPLSQEDKAKIDGLLPFLNGEAFSAKSLRDDSVRNDNLELARALDAIGNSNKSLGRLLARCAAAHYGVRRIVSDKPPTLYARLF